jgi:hypothetical protein
MQSFFSLASYFLILKIIIVLREKIVHKHEVEMMRSVSVSIFRMCNRYFVTKITQYYAINRN